MLAEIDPALPNAATLAAAAVAGLNNRDAHHAITAWMYLHRVRGPGSWRQLVTAIWEERKRQKAANRAVTRSVKS